MGIRAWVKRRIREAGAYRESETRRGGFLSYSWEWHSIWHGLYMGVATKPWITPPEPTRDDVQKESHYYRGGYVIGTLVQWAILLTVTGTAAETFGLIP